MAYGDLNYTTEEINADLKKVHDKESVVDEAPANGKQYGRKDGTWTVIEANSEHTLDLSPFFDEEGSPVATVSDEFLVELQKAYDEKYSNAILPWQGYNFLVPMQIANDEGLIILNISYRAANPQGIAESAFQIHISETDKTVQYANPVYDITISGEGTKALTDNGQYAEFAKPTKVESRGSGGSQVTKQIKPNTFYKFWEVNLTITLAAEESGIYNEYMFEFVSGTTPTTLSLPYFVKWSGGEAPTIEANKTYQVSIVNNLAVYAAF